MFCTTKLAFRGPPGTPPEKLHGCTTSATCRPCTMPFAWQGAGETNLASRNSRSPWQCLEMVRLTAAVAFGLCALVTSVPRCTRQDEGAPFRSSVTSAWGLRCVVGTVRRGLLSSSNGFSWPWRMYNSTLAQGFLHYHPRPETC